jgi:Tol biopolymer transport system component
LVTTTLAVPLGEWQHGPAQSIALSADGRWVAFTAPSERDYDDLYLYDRTQGALTRITTAPDGSASNGWVGAPAMVPDGRYLAFYAWASNLVARDTNAVQDLFLYDRTTGTMSRLSVAANGGQANDRSGDSRGSSAPALSADGRYVAFHSAASNFTRGDSNNRTDVFVYDRQAMITTLISHDSNGVAGNGDSTNPALSADGRYILFQSRATNLDPAVPVLESPGATQIYLHDRTDGSTILISRGPDGRPGDGDSSAPVISGDGHYLAYASNATNLVAGDTNQVADIFLHDRTSGETRRVSVSSTGIQANRAAWSPQITLDGRYILFGADASNLVNGDGNNVADLFIYDQQARHTSRVSVGVRGLWTGQEANGPTRGPAAIIPGGRLVAFVSQATNLTPTNLANANGVPGLYLHERVDAPTFTLSGQVAESSGHPVADVVVAAGPHRTVTDANGRFQLSTLVGGTYTLAVAKAGYTFSPPRRTISLLSDLGSQDFLAYSGGGPDAFLDLPLVYDGSAATLMALLRDTDEGGWIDAWFDHDAPTYSKNGSMLLWDGRQRNLELYNPSLGCYERRCYEGHDGVDFPYRDPNASTPNLFEPVQVRPAATGVVAAVVQNCESGDRWCNGGYGNEVILWHDNGYFTRYSHLATVTVEKNQRLTPDLTLGEMGSTGNSLGTHLHFAVHVDRSHGGEGNGVWDGDRVDLPIDPFGWAGLAVDPWAAQAGAVSRWLWRFNPSTEAILLGSEGATLRDGVGNVTVRIPAGALAGQVRVELVTGAAVASPANPQRTLGRTFRLQVLDWLQGGSAPNAAPARPVEISAGFTGAATRHLDIEKLLLYHWQGGRWSPLPTVVNSEAQAVVAASNQFGDFDLQAPLLCPADALEPDDSFDAARAATGTASSWERLFDVAEDEDWFQVEAVAGTSYQAAVDVVAPGVALTVELYDRDGLTRLDHQRGSGTLAWTAAEAGTYFVRVAAEAGSHVGCDASYRLTVSQSSGSQNNGSQSGASLPGN